MSWSVTLSAPSRYEMEQKVRQAELEDTYNREELVAEWRGQLEAAKDAAYALLEDPSALGSGGTFTVSMGGHCARGPRSEANDYTKYEFVTVTIATSYS